jgi:hypothetical protein
MNERLTSTRAHNYLEARGADTDPATAIGFSARVDIAAAVASNPATFSIVAYTGGRMKPSQWADEVVIDLAGVTAGESVPLIADHRNALDSLLGSGSVRVDTQSNQITIAGRLAAGTMLADHLIKLAKAGVTVQASVGGAVLRSEFVRGGESVTVNGQTFDGPVQVARAMELREVSVLPAGADSGTSVSIAATGAVSGTTPNPVTAERDRIARIDALCAGFTGPESHRVAELRAQAIGEQITERELSASMVQLLREGRPTVVPAGIASGSGRVTTEVLAAAALMHSGFGQVAESAFGRGVVQRAEDLRAYSALDLCAAALQVDGKPVPSDRNAMISAAFSTLSLPTALGAAAEKILLDRFGEEPATWSSIARPMNLKNFREHPTVRAYMTGRLEQVAPTGELKYASIGEAAGTIKGDTYGAIIGISRHDVINDDLHLCDEISAMAGTATRRRMSDDCYELLLGNPDSFFSAGNGNYFSGSGSALSAASLSEAVKLLRKMVDENGRPLSLRPTVLLVPPELETTAKQILESTELGTADGSPTGNAMKGVAKLEVEPRLSNSTFTGYSETAWYLFAQPSVGALQVGLLNGKANPTVEFFGVTADPERLGLSWRVYHDYGFALGEYRGAVMSKGEA